MGLDCINNYKTFSVLFQHLYLKINRGIACPADLFFYVSCRCSTSQLQLQSTEIRQRQQRSICKITVGPDL